MKIQKIKIRHLLNSLIASFTTSQSILKIYYTFKPLIPRAVQLYLRQKIAIRKRGRFLAVWPIDENNRVSPSFHKGWPQQKRFALVLTHDVDTAKGYRQIRTLANLEIEMGFRSCFYFVPERYDIEDKDLIFLMRNGFEIGVHGLYHDGKLFRNYNTFHIRAPKINSYLNRWNAKGFRSPCMHHNLEWLHELQIEYDASTFDTDPFEPQPYGVDSIFPMLVKGHAPQRPYIELPYTLPQDCTLYLILKENNIDIWKQKLDWLAGAGGMALLITHPDYMTFDSTRSTRSQYPASFYKDFLSYLIDRYKDQYWHVLPKDMAEHWRSCEVDEQIPDTITAVG
jgi:hypothetical protein